MQLPTPLTSATSDPAAASQPEQPPTPSYGRPALPSRNVREDTIEDAYVQFILCCNPAVPPDTDPTALRDAFRVPPKSEGKTFSTFHLYQLIGQLTIKEEVKTWGDLALRLGVEPPNQEKNQSTQKIQQYAVRLKRWMKSMHIDAFFDYLYDNLHVYFTQIPHESIPIEEIARDGVAPEDDMALRALLPHIRPRRGRRTREDDEAARSSSSKVARLESPLTAECAINTRPDSLEPWATHNAGLDGRNATHQGLSTPPANHSWTSDTSRAHIMAHPQSAITPSTRTDFWADEPRSAITPDKANRSHKRHGPKVVSSAWRSGQASSGKTRGRPPINRVSNEGPFSAYPTDGPPMSVFRPSPPEATIMSTTPSAASVWPSGAGGDGGGSCSTMAVADVLMTPQQHHPHQQYQQQHQNKHQTQNQNQNQNQHQTQHQNQHQALSPYPTPPALPSLNTSLSVHEQHPVDKSCRERSSKPKGLSLQVPERVGGEVRLATPRPVVMVNGQAVPIPNAPETTPPLFAEDPMDSARREAPMAVGQPRTAEPVDSKRPSPPVAEGAPDPLPSMSALPSSKQKVFYRDPADRTNIQALEGFFMHEIMTGNWVDKDGNQLPAGGADEAYAIVSTVIDTLQKEAQNEKAFLLNVSALAGGNLLMTTTSLRITVADVLEDRTEYYCEWQLQLGSCKGLYKMKEVVEHAKWKLPPTRLGTAGHRDVQVGAAAYALKSSPPPPSKVSKDLTSNGSGHAHANNNTSNTSGPSAVGAGSVDGGPSASSSAGTGGQSDEGSIDHWKERCRSLAESLDKQKTEYPAEHWKNMYLELVEMYKRKDLELARLQSRVMDALREPRLDRGS